MTYLDYLEKKVLLERLVIGLEEPVLVKGLGELQAKIDSGNGGYNVIHGTDFHQQGDVLLFTTHDSFGHEKKISAKIIDDIEVNMGGGNIEKRPVIELDIKFAGEDYKKIPFSVSDRSSNTHPILVSKGFVENELEALIDVGAKNISNDGVDVVYGESVALDEGVLGAIGKGIGSTVKGVSKTAGDIKRGMQTVGNVYNRAMKGVSNFGDWLGGNAKMSDWTPSKQGMKDMAKQAVAGVLSATGIRSVWKMAARMKSGLSLNTEDPKQILKKFNISKDIPQLYENHEATQGTIFDKNNNQELSGDQIIPIFNFSFQKGKIGSKNYVKGMENQAKKYKKAISQAKEGVQSRQKDIDDKNLADESEGVKQKQDDIDDYNKNKKDFNKWKENQTQQNDSFDYEETLEILNESLLLFEDDGQQQSTDNTQDITEDDVQEIDTNFKNLCEFFLWFCPVSAYESKADKNDPNVLQKMEAEIKNHNNKVTKAVNQIFTSGQFDKEFAKIYSTSSPVTPNLFNPLIEKLVSSASSNDNKNLLQGIFCLAYATNPDQTTKREYSFFKNDKQIIYISPKENQEAENSKKLEQDKKQFTQRVKEIIPFDKVNMQFNFDYVQLLQAMNGKGEFADAINALMNNHDSFPKSFPYLDALTSGNNMTPQDKQNNLEKLGAMMNQEYPLYVIKQTPEGASALAALGDYQWGGEQDFIDKCFENEQARTAFLAPNFVRQEQQILNTI